MTRIAETAIAATRGLAGMAEQLAGAVQKVTSADAVFLYGTTPEAELLPLASSTHEEALASSEPPALEVAAMALHTQQVREVARVDDLEASTYPQTRALRDRGLRSMFALPLEAAGRPVGALVVARRQEGRLAREERKIVEAAAASCAVALAHARAVLDARAESERFRRLRKAATGINDPLPLRELLRRVVEQACAITEARYGALAALGQDGRVAEFVFVGMSDEEARRIGACPLGRGLLEEVATSRMPLRVGDISGDPRSIGFPQHHPVMTTFLGVPLQLGTEVFGNFYLCDKAGGAEFTEDDQAMLELLGAQSSLAIAYARQLERAEEAHARLSELRDEFAAVIAHDLRTPISIILLQVENLVEGAEADRDHVVVPIAALDRIRRSAHRISQMAADLLDASRIELNRIQLDRRAMSIVEATSALLTEMALTFGDRPVDVDAEPDVPDVWADPLRLDQILTNLLENAAKYSSPGSPIRVVIRREDDGATVTVEDRGIGIPPDEIPRLFDRFYQARRARKKKTGLGLGLYITKGLVEAHGGRLWVESTPGKGSAFHVWLPVVESAPDEPR